MQYFSITSSFGSRILEPEILIKYHLCKGYRTVLITQVMPGMQVSKEIYYSEKQKNKCKGGNSETKWCKTPAEVYGRDYFRLLLRFLNVINPKGCDKWLPPPAARGPGIAPPSCWNLAQRARGSVSQGKGCSCCFPVCMFNQFVSQRHTCTHTHTEDTDTASHTDKVLPSRAPTYRTDIKHKLRQPNPLLLFGQ